MNTRRIVVRAVGYTLYGIIVFVALLYVMFPYDLLRQRLMERASQGNVRVTVAQMRPGFPPGVHLRNVSVEAKQVDLPGALIQTGMLDAQPELLPLLSGTLRLHLEGMLYGGSLQGEVRAPGANGSAVWEVNGRVVDLHLAQHPLLQRDNTAFVRGRLGGNLALTLDTTGKIQQGTLDLMLRPLVFAGNKGLRFPLQREITCDTVQSQIKMTARQLQIVSLICRGNDLTIEARGTVAWRQPLMASALNIHLQVQSETAYKQELNLLGGLVRKPPDRRGALSFRLRGTLQRPRIGA